MKITKEEFEALLDKYLNGLALPEETKLLDEFFDSYHKKPGDVTEISEEVKGEILQNIQTRIGTTTRSADRSRGFNVWLRFAAAISFFLIASYFLYPYLSPTQTNQPLAVKVKEVSAFKGQKLDIKLPDGTRIKLNANSRISYPENFSGSTREVTLDGEAYFDVRHNPSRPFIVYTQYATTQVIGTSFNVNTTQEAIAVTLVNGKVNVSVPNGKTALLAPDQQAIIARGSTDIVTHKVSVEKYIGWKDNTLRFDHITVKEAFAIIENWYNVEIKVKDPALMNCIITSKYENESLENVLNSFLFMLKMDFKINGRLVTVSGKGCN
jgi:ferric-dicitrate binding protein FerR (iron transport regulator)